MLQKVKGVQERYRSSHFVRSTSMILCGSSFDISFHSPFQLAHLFLFRSEEHVEGCSTMSLREMTCGSSPRGPDRTAGADPGHAYRVAVQQRSAEGRPQGPRGMEPGGSLRSTERSTNPSDETRMASGAADVAGHSCVHTSGNSSSLLPSSGVHDPTSSETPVTPQKPRPASRSLDPPPTWKKKSSPLPDGIPRSSPSRASAENVRVVTSGWPL